MRDTHEDPESSFRLVLLKLDYNCLSRILLQAQLKVDAVPRIRCLVHVLKCPSAHGGLHCLVEVRVVESENACLDVGLGVELDGDRVGLGVPRGGPPPGDNQALHFREIEAGGHSAMKVALCYL